MTSPASALCRSSTSTEDIEERHERRIQHVGSSLPAKADLGSIRDTDLAAACVEIRLMICVASASIFVSSPVDEVCWTLEEVDLDKPVRIT